MSATGPPPPLPFPDAQHVAAIRRALWTDRQTGRAAVLVGAGMSCNAVPRGAGPQGMPTWDGLTRALIGELYPPGSGGDRRAAWLQQAAGAVSEATRLADEYAATFGRTALDALVRRAIPDDDFEPGPLHERLLDLPWADVLTTNYDTLLEKAAGRVPGRRYAVVRRPDELAAVDRPRIVKLHGSFPSNGPFILTEDDFRTYPRRFAPFVNLARQAAMENTLVLVGFSGDDPNFLAWTGWVRDELAEYAPRVYLCGLLGLSGSQRMLLTSRGVIPIDLSPVVPADHPNRHADALGWLLRCLAAGRRPDPLDWPAPPPPLADVAGPPLLPTDQSCPRQEVFSPRASADWSAQVTVWRHNRGCYPGWLVAPTEVRGDVWLYTRFWYENYAHTRDGRPPLADLDILYELNWRFELTLTPVFSDLRPAYEAALARVNPFPREITDLPADAVAPGTPAGDIANWAEVGRQWLAVAFAYLRFCREERLDDEFERWRNRLDKVRLYDPDHRARLRYERCLHALANLDDEAALNALAGWPEETTDIFWRVRKSGMLAELGRTDAAGQLAQAALNAIRHGLIDTFSHIPTLSREGWAASLVQYIDQAISFHHRNPINSHSRHSVRVRYRRLRPFGADPVELGDWFSAQLAGPPPRPGGLVERLGFEPGTVRRTLSSGGDYIKRLLPAYQFTRLTEEVGQPPAILNSHRSRDQMRAVGEWLANIDPVRTQSLLFRLRDEKLLDHYLTRHRVAALPADVVSGWRAMAMRAVATAIPAAGHGAYETSPVEHRARDSLFFAVHLLGRLTVRSTAAERGELWQLVRTLYDTPAVRASLSSDPLKSLVKSLAGADTPAELISRLPTLFDLPMPGEVPLVVPHPDHWLDPPLAAWRELRHPSPLPDANPFREAARRALAALASDDQQLRRVALWRARALDDLGLMTDAERADLGRLFWERVAEGEYLPLQAWGSGAGWLALSISTPDGSSAAERVRVHVLTRLPVAEQEPRTLPGELADLIVEATQRPGVAVGPRRGYVTWTVADRRRMLDAFRGWWQSRDRAADQPRGLASLFGADDANRLLSDIWDVIRQVILPPTAGRAGLIADVLQLVADVRAAGWPVGSVLPATLLARPAAAAVEIASQLRRELAHADYQFRLAALRGIDHWSDLLRARRRRPAFPPLPVDLQREVGFTVAARRPEVLRLALQCAGSIVRNLGRSIDAQFREGLLVGLEYLLTESAYTLTPRDSDPVGYDEWPNVRRQAARLARQLADAGFGREGVVTRWVTAAAADPLPEVRAAVEPAASDNSED